MSIKFRGETLATACYSLRQAADLLSKSDKDGFQQSCISCMNFEESSELCKKYNARPPARIIALSCEAYQDQNEIPF